MRISLVVLVMLVVATSTAFAEQRYAVVIGANPGWSSDRPLGDELVVRVELRVDRDMEYVHLKDQRGSGTEPVNVLTQTKFQDGLAYYEGTRDTASHFFIHYSAQGRVRVRVQRPRPVVRQVPDRHLASIQCMYAPEFNSHSESFDLEVK